MPNLNLVNARLVDDPASHAMYEYVVAGNGLFVRAEDDRIAACIPVARAHCDGLPDALIDVCFKLPRISDAYLLSVYQSARRRMPNEAAYQFIHEPPLPWRVVCPSQAATPVSVDFQDDANAVVDLHSHGALDAFFSTTDDIDEGGLRIYCVIGRIDGIYPTIKVRVGVYGHHWEIPATRIFDGLGPFVALNPEHKP